MLCYDPKDWDDAPNKTDRSFRAQTTCLHLPLIPDKCNAPCSQRKMGIYGLYRNYLFKKLKQLELGIFWKIQDYRHFTNTIKHRAEYIRGP